MKIFKINILTGEIEGYSVLNEYSLILRGDFIAEDISDLDLSYFKDTVYPKYAELYNRKVSLQKEFLNLKYHYKSKNDFFNKNIFDKKDKSFSDLIDISEKDFNDQEDRIKSIKSEMLEISKELEHAKYIEWDKFIDMQHNYHPIYTSGICLLAKDEDLYLDEWITHHLNIGIDHIYIYDNGSKFPISKFITKYSKAVQDKITVIDFSDTYRNIQSECYNDFLINYSDQFKWVAFTDADEFINIQHNKSINDFLNLQEGISVIYMDYQEYGANGQLHYEDKPLRDRFKANPVEVDGSYAPKAFCRCNKIDRFETHYPRYYTDRFTSMNTDKDDENSIFIEHYYTKSFDEFVAKIDKGTCDPEWARRLYNFFDYNPDMEYLKESVEDVSQLYQGTKVTNRS